MGVKVTASEFARMCGVSPMAVCKRIQAGVLVRENKRLDTDNPKNRAYLESHQAKMKSQLEMRQTEAAILSGAADSGVSAGRNAGLSVALDSPLDALARSDVKMDAQKAIQVGELFLNHGSKRGNATFADTSQSVKGRGDFSSSAGTVAMAGAGKAHEMLSLPVGQLVRRFGSVDAIEKYSKILRDLSTADEREQKTQERRLLQVPKDFVVQRMFGYVDSLMNQLLDVPESVSDQVIATALAGGDDVRVKVMHILSDNLTKCISGVKEHIIAELNTLKGKYDKAENSVIDLRAQLEEMQEVG